MKNILLFLTSAACVYTTGFSQSAGLSGKVLTLNEAPIPGLIVHLTDSNMVLLSTDTTDAQGNYSFEELPTGTTYHVVPQEPPFDGDYLNGISTFDIVIAARYILGIAVPTNPYAWIAGDVNNSGSLSILDIVLMRKVVLSIDTEFPGSTLTRYIRANTTFINPDYPNNRILYGSPFISLEEPVTDFDFYEIQLGNLNP